nr:hypothetical protein [Gemmatimonadota bacterium]
MRITASLVGQFFRFRCNRQFIWESIPVSERGPAIPVGERPVAGELLREAGREWERRQLRRLIWRVGDDRVLHGGWDENGRARKLPYTQVVAALREPGELRFLLQPELQLPDPDAFARHWGLDPSRVAFATGQPDLLQIRRTSRGLRFRLIDIKASREAGLAHFAQVAFYTFLLEEICRAEGLPGRTDTRRARIWSRSGAELFDLRPYRHHLRRFFREELPGLSSTAPAESAWHVDAGCTGCGFRAHCRAEANRTDDLARVPGITPLAKQVLQARGIHTVRDLTGAFRRDTYTGCHALESQSLVLKQRAQALRYGKIFDVQRETHRMGASAAEPILIVAE